MKLGTFSVVGLAATMLMAAGSAEASLALQQSAGPPAGVLPAGSSSLFTAVGTLNFGNQKARLEAAGQTTLQGGNPGNGWWNNQLRSWEVLWDNDTSTVTFKVYGTSDWSGTAAMTMTRTQVFTAGNILLGLDIGARLTAATQSVTLGSVQFNDGSGWADVDSAEATYSGNANFNNYHALVGTLGDFTLRGTAIFPTGSVTSDGMRFFINARQGAAPAVPLPATVCLLGSALVGLVGIGRRRKASWTTFVIQVASIGGPDLAERE